MIPGLPRDVGEAHVAPGVKDEDAALLPGISLGCPLSVSPAPSAKATLQDTQSDDCLEAAPQARRGEGFELGIEEQGKLDGPLFSKVASLLAATAADGHQARPSGANLGLDAAQLRDLLTAEQSAEMTQEDKHQGPLTPKLSELDAFLIGVL